MHGQPAPARPAGVVRGALDGSIIDSTVDREVRSGLHRFVLPCSPHESGGRNDVRQPLAATKCEHSGSGCRGRRARDPTRIPQEAPILLRPSAAATQYRKADAAIGVRSTLANRHPVDAPFGTTAGPPRVPSIDCSPTFFPSPSNGPDPGLCHGGGLLVRRTPEPPSAIGGSACRPPNARTQAVGRDPSRSVSARYAVRLHARR
jgi:hypothetical protein